MKKRIWVISFVMAVTAWAYSNAYASSDYLSLFNSQYGTSGTALNSCSVCHSATPALNSYGNAYLNSGYNFAAIESQDSDGDTFTNIVEINARTFPGNAASYPIGSGGPGAATLTSPSGAISDATPTYTWNAVSDATWYCLYVNDSTGNKINQWYTAAQANCPLGIDDCTVTSTIDVRGAGQWWVRTYNSAGFGPWSSGMSFTAPTPAPPSAATQVSPTGAIGDTTPTYTWDAVSNATWYCLYVNDSTGNRINQWYAAADVGCADGAGTCSVTPAMEVRGAGQWWIRTYSSAGYGPWSLPGVLFTAPTPLAPSAATQVSPSGTINDITPTYTWNPVANATWYQLWVGDSSGNKIKQWYAAADAGCPDGVGTCSVTPATMVLGPLIWYIQTYNSGGLGPWSLPGMSFTAVSP
jgi:hypothetical protein